MQQSDLHDELLHAESLLQELEANLDQGLVPQRLMNDRGIYQLELERLFARAWVFVGHESEIPSPGDYVLRYIGEDPFIFTRDEEGHPRVLFNSCRHRGTLICRSEKGNTSHFRCPYHGWTYRNNGDLIGVPYKNEGYKNLKLSEWGLHSATHVRIYEGLVFASLDPDPVPFDQYIGDYRWYLDANFKLLGGVEVIGEPHRWVVENADWKVAALNFAGDAYHITVTHRSAIESRLAFPNAGFTHSPSTTQIAECSGHSIGIVMWDETLTEQYFWGLPQDITEKFNKNAVSKDQYEMARRSIVNVGTLFPNLSFIHAGEHTDSPDKPTSSFFSLRQWQPRGPGRMEIWSWMLGPKGASKEQKERFYKVGTSAFSPAGNFEQDDIAVWNGISTTAGTVFADKIHNNLNYQMGLEWMSGRRPRSNWPGPGIAYTSDLEEGTQRTFWRHYLKMMTKKE